MYADEGIDTDYIRDDVKLVVETVEESLVITYADLEAQDVYDLAILFIGRLSDMTGQTYNQVCTDLKEIEGE